MVLGPDRPCFNRKNHAAKAGNGLLQGIVGIGQYQWRGMLALTNILRQRLSAR